jgi:hypothetical protein
MYAPKKIVLGTGDFYGFDDGADTIGCTYDFAIFKDPVQLVLC